LSEVSRYSLQQAKHLRVSLFGKIEEKVNGRKWRMGENEFRILEETSPILHSSFIVHHSSFSLSPLLLNSFVLHFFKPLNSYEKSYLLKKKGR